jgi:hypothetical protein
MIFLPLPRVSKKQEGKTERKKKNNGYSVLDRKIRQNAPWIPKKTTKP